ncbi:MAG: hypothetical protein LBH16_05975 [Treponema sp.]|jgi:hypothetical protein|nr:hypothetical protein [Treponema sp.]
MNFHADVTKSNIEDYLRDYGIIICRIRNSRIKAKQTAVLEMIFANFDNEILAVFNGPLGDIKGIVSFFCPRKNLASFKERLYGIGYCYKFYYLDFENETSCLTQSGSPRGNTDLISVNPLVWKGKKFSIKDFYCQDGKIYEEQSPHNREFKITGSDGEVKTVFGYRGDGSEYGRRSLPAEDARCMVNLSIPHRNKRIIDPFAGGGGIISAFRYIEPAGAAASVDIDPVLKPGLEFYGSAHYVQNSAGVAFPENSFDSVVTETPFSANALGDIVSAFNKLYASLSDNGMYVVMCEKNQSDGIFSAMDKMGVFLLFSQKIDRKGTDVEISVWCKDKTLCDNMKNFLEALRKIF